MKDFGIDTKLGIDINVGAERWYCDGKLHRVDGPAVVWKYGATGWYQHGKLHRLDGPAVELSNGGTHWCIDDIEYTEEEFNNHPLVLMTGFIQR